MFAHLGGCGCGGVCVGGGWMSLAFLVEGIRDRILLVWSVVCRQWTRAATVLVVVAVDVMIQSIEQIKALAPRSQQRMQTQWPHTNPIQAKELNQSSRNGYRISNIEMERKRRRERRNKLRSRSAFPSPNAASHLSVIDFDRACRVVFAVRSPSL